MNIAKVEISKSHMAAIDSYCLANYHKREGVSTIFRSKTPYASYKAGVMGEVVVADYCMGSDIGEYLEKRPAGIVDCEAVESDLVAPPCQFANGSKD